MLRVCGSEGERDSLTRRRCWCYGVFCGPGGHKLSIQFRRDFRNATVALSREQFNDLIGQADLFNGDELRAKWQQRITGPVLVASKGRKRA